MENGEWRMENGDPVDFGLKGRFCQPRSKAWVSDTASRVGPEGAVHLPPRTDVQSIRINDERPLQGRMTGGIPVPGLWPGLTE